MASSNTVTLAAHVYEAVTERAEAEGVTLDQAANEAIEVGLQEASWAAFLAKGRSYGEASGHTPDDLEQVRDDWRNGR